MASDNVCTGKVFIEKEKLVVGDGGWESYCHVKSEIGSFREIPTYHEASVLERIIWGSSVYR